jgi:phosphate transport system substrate-binding protein
VAATPGAIGYTMMVSAGERSLLVDGHAASPDTVEDQSYPLTTPIYFVSLAEPTGPVRDFLAWLQSPEGQAELREKYGQVR